MDVQNLGLSGRQSSFVSLKCPSFENDASALGREVSAGGIVGLMLPTWLEDNKMSDSESKTVGSSSVGGSVLVDSVSLVDRVRLWIDDARERVLGGGEGNDAGAARPSPVDESDFVKR